MSFATFYQRSIDDPSAFWGEQARRIDWHHPFLQVLDDSRPPFAKWFFGGTTNLCHNAVDCWLATRGDQPALIAISTETNTEKTYSLGELQAEVDRTAAVMQSLGVGRSERVLIYMPMIAEAMFAMRACARIGAIHSVVFGGFASNSLASRIDDATLALIVSADAGSRGGKVLLDDAIKLAQHKPAHVLLVNRGLAPMEMRAGRDVDYAEQRQGHIDAKVSVVWLESNEASYILYTSSTT